MKEIPYGAIAMCAQDFISALSNRPKIIRLLLRWIFGDVAYHEFILLVDCFIQAELYMNYELDNSHYHSIRKYPKDFSVGLRKY